MEIFPSFLTLFLDAGLSFIQFLPPLVQSQAAIGVHHNPLFFLF